MKIKSLLLTSLITLALTSAALGQTELRGTYYSIYGQQFINGWQSLRLAAENPRYSDSEIVPCIRVTMVLNFFESPVGDASGPLRPLRRVTREFELDPGEAASFDVAATMACDGSSCPAARNGVFVGVSIFATPVEGEPVTGPLKFNTTLAVREFGRSIFTLPAVQKGFDPQPDPPAVSGGKKIQ